MHLWKPDMQCRIGFWIRGEDWRRPENRWLRQLKNWRNYFLSKSFNRFIYISTPYYPQQAMKIKTILLMCLWWCKICWVAVCGGGGFVTTSLRTTRDIPFSLSTYVEDTWPGVELHIQDWKSYPTCPLVVPLPLCIELIQLHSPSSVRHLEELLTPSDSPSSPPLEATFDFKLKLDLNSSLLFSSLTTR